MAHQMLFASPLPDPSKIGWAWGVAANNIRVPQPFMGFYWNMPDEAPCIFSTADQGREKRKFQRGCAPHRPVIAWDENRFRAAAATLRAKHGSIVQTMTRPRIWEDLYQWFDAYDIWFMGAWNLWLLLHLVCDENEGVFDPYARFRRHHTTIVDEVSDWAYKWCTHGSNLLKLRNWEPRGDILDVLGPDDRENILGCGAKALDVLRSALHFWCHQYKPPAPQRDSQPCAAELTQASMQNIGTHLRLEPRPRSSPPHGHARRRSSSLPDLPPPPYLKSNPAIVIVNRTGAVRRESSMPGLRAGNSEAVQYDTCEHAIRYHHHPSKSGPVPSIPTGPLMTSRGKGVENSGPSRLPSRLMQPAPLLNGHSHLQEQPQFPPLPATANFSAPQRDRNNGSFGMRDTPNRSDCRNVGPHFPWSAHKRDSFEACPCQRCMRRSRSVHVAPIDEADGVSVENMRDSLIRYFGRWGHVEEVEMRPSKCDVWYAIIRYISEASARQAVAAARKGQTANPLLARSRIRHPYYSKYFARENGSPSRDNRSSWSSNKGNSQEGQPWSDQRYQRSSGDFSTLQATPVRPQQISSPRTPGNAPSPSIGQSGQGHAPGECHFGYPGPCPYNHTAWADPYAQLGGPGPGHLQNPSPTLHGPPPLGHCEMLSRNWSDEAIPPGRTPFYSEPRVFCHCGPESPLAARHGSQVHGAHHWPQAPNPCPPRVHNRSPAPSHFLLGPNGDASMQTKPAFEEGILSEERSSTKGHADSASSAARIGSIRVRLPSMLPGKYQATPAPIAEQETQSIPNIDKRHVDIPDSNGITKDGALGLIKFGDVNSPMPPSGCIDLAAPEPRTNTHQDNGNSSIAGVSGGQGYAGDDRAFDWQLNPLSRLNTGDIRLDPDYSATVRHRPHSRQPGLWSLGNCYANSDSWDGNQVTYSAIPYQHSGSWPVRGPQDVAFSGQPQPVPQSTFQHQLAEAGVSTQPGHRKRSKFKGKHKTSQGTNSHVQTRTSTPVPSAGSDDTAHEQPGRDMRNAFTQGGNNKNKQGKSKTKAKPKNSLPSSSEDSQPGVCTAQNGGSSTLNAHGAQEKADTVDAASPKKGNAQANDKASDKPPVPDQTEGVKGEEKAAGVGNNRSGYRADAGGSLRVPRKRWGKETTTRVDARDVFGVREEE